MKRKIIRILKNAGLNFNVYKDNGRWVAGDDYGRNEKDLGKTLAEAKEKAEYMAEEVEENLAYGAQLAADQLVEFNKWASRPENKKFLDDIGD